MKPVLTIISTLFIFLLIASSGYAATVTDTYNPDDDIFFDLDGDTGLPALTELNITHSISTNFSSIRMIYLRVGFYDNPTDLDDEYVRVTVNNTPYEFQITGNRYNRNTFYIRDLEDTGIDITSLSVKIEAIPGGDDGDDIYDCDFYFTYSSLSVSGTIAPDPVPVPSAMLLICSGLIGLVGLRRKSSR